MLSPAIVINARSWKRFKKEYEMTKKQKPSTETAMGGTEREQEKLKAERAEIGSNIECATEMYLYTDNLSSMYYTPC